MTKMFKLTEKQICGGVNLSVDKVYVVWEIRQ